LETVDQAARGEGAGERAVPGHVPRDEDGVSEPLLFAASVDTFGRLKFDQPEVRQHLLARLAGKRVVEQIKREVLTRTIEDNRALWGDYTEAVGEGPDLIDLSTGQPVFMTPEDVHSWAKLLFLRRPVETNRGHMDLLGTTTTLTREELQDYRNLFVAKLANLGVYVRPGSERGR